MSCQFAVVLLDVMTAHMSVTTAPYHDDAHIDVVAVPVHGAASVGATTA